MYEILDGIDSPEDLRKLEISHLPSLCAEIRSYMLECCSRNPGHLASSLGAVELIVGMHYVYDTPRDQIVFDVGHQAYAHKIICSRREAFASMRTEGGVSGFPSREESAFDSFGVGHSSTSVSAALGLAEAARMQGLSRKVVALIGDGALTGGLAYEGLNNAGASNADLLVILNDNNQSIDGNIGAMHDYLLKITASSGYNRFKDRVWNALGDRSLRGFVQRWVRSLKSWFVKRSGGDFFESLGFRYFGPIDGNDIFQVVSTLRKIQKIKGPRIIHCYTVKGKGYAPAEQDPVTWHAPGKFNVATGERTPSVYPADRYQDVFGQTLVDLASADPKVVGITPAMASGCSMNLLAKALPGQFFDVGIEEEHAVTFSAGLSAGGMKPFCNIYSSFSQRAYDQIVHDLALQHLPVTVCLDRAGLVGEDGATHHGMLDLAALRCVPDTIISSPKDEAELRSLMYTAYLNERDPFIIRYPRGTGEGVRWRDTAFEALPVGKARTLLEGSDVAVVGIGPVVNRALKAASLYPGKVGVYNFRFLKPLDEDLLKRIASTYKYILTIEDGNLKGGLFGAVSEFLAGIPLAPPVEGIGVPDEFVPHGRQGDQREKFGLSEQGIGKRLKKFLEERK